MHIICSPGFEPDHFVLKIVKYLVDLTNLLCKTCNEFDLV